MTITPSSDLRNAEPDFSLFDEALCHLDDGIAVIPIKHGTKRPLVAWKDYQDRLPTKAEIQRWFTDWPNADIAILCGYQDLAILDIDSVELAERIMSESAILDETIVAS